MPIPTQARIVIVGGGIAGCSTAYHLGLLGERDVLLLEQGQLTCGTTWHAAGLIGQMRPNRNMTAMSRYGIELYARLETETGLATGWKQCGSVNVAASAERWQVFAKQAALARSFGVDVETGQCAARRRAVPAAAQRRPAWRDLDSRRRQGQPGGSVHVAWPRAHACAVCASPRTSRSAGC